MSDTPRTDAAWKARLIAVSEQRAEDEPTMLEFARQLERELVGAVSSRNDLINDLYRSLAWAHRNLGSAPRLVAGQNDSYYTAWHEAKDLINLMREVKGAK